MSHTPGPWTLSPCSHGGFLLQRGEVKSGRFVHPQHSLQIVPEEDAHLIAAAPDLLDAVKEYIEWGAMTGSDRDLFDQKFRAAIAKAEGK